MKKIYFLGLFLMLFQFVANAETLSDEARRFRSSMQSFLREEGFSPYIDDDGSLCFKKEGELFWIDFSDEKPVYVRFARLPLNAEDANMVYAMAAANDINKDYKAIKCYYNNKSVSMCIEAFYRSAEDFKYVFYKYLSILSNTKERLKDAYNEYDN